MRFLALALLCLGCQSLNPVTPAGDSASNRVISGLPSEVNGRVQEAFRGAGVSGGACAAWMDEKGEGMSVVGQTTDGRRFRVILQQAGRSTRASVAWDGEPDDTVERKILAGLAKE